MLGALAIGERMAMPDLVIEGDAQSPLIFTRGPVTWHRLDPDVVTVFMDEDAARNGQVLTADDVRRLIEWFDETTEWYCTTHEMGGSACGSETCSVGREHHDSINCSPVRR